MDKKENLVVLWTSGDIEVAEKMVYMYTFNAKKQNWWKDIVFIIWGPSAKLLSENMALQEQIKEFIAIGIKVKACKACADGYGVSENLSSLGIDVKYMGEPLTKYLKYNYKTVTF
jgi:hypothetical protein